MSYEKMTIKQVIEKINNNEIYLPAIQRKFVWTREKSEKLFDSIQQGYPIGTFLFWFLKKPYIDSYVFYRFLKDYHERDSYLNERIPNPELKDEIIGVLDGQQRLSSLYLALQGTYANKLPYQQWTNDNAFPRRNMYINLLSEISSDDDNEYNFSFKFLTENEASKMSKTDLWFQVRKVLKWEKDSPPIDEEYDKLFDRYEKQKEDSTQLGNSTIRNRIKRILRDLHSRLVRDELINYFKIEEQEMDNILKIFVRVNSGGMILSKTDLLFSTIVANWEEGRDEIESFIKTINKIGDGFSFNNDFVMRACLVLTDCDVLFKVGNFKTENVVKIKEKWDSIKEAIEKTVQLVTEFGLNGSTLLSNNALMPILYYAIKGGTFDTTAKNEIKKYLYRALLKNIFSGQGDTVLQNFRNTLRVKKDGIDDYTLKKKEFCFEDMLSTKLPSNKTLKITDDDIENFLNLKKGVSAFLVLAFLYPNLKFSQIKFHQDHVHPVSQFTPARMKSVGIKDEDHRKYIEIKDTLPNLQLLEGTENIKKGKTPFHDWLHSKDEADCPVINDIDKYLADNYIDSSLDLTFGHFLDFYQNRKEKMKAELEKILT